MDLLLIRIGRLNGAVVAGRIVRNGQVRNVDGCLRYLQDTRIALSTARFGIPPSYLSYPAHVAVSCGTFMKMS